VVSFTGLIPGARQPKHGTDGFRSAEASGHIDGSAIGQCDHRADTRDCHQAAAHLLIPHNRQQVQQAAVQPAPPDQASKAGLHFRNQMEVGPGGKQVLLEDPDGNPIESFEPAH
jgi:hypothetical protein